jgi:hypothetical protein
MSYDDLMRVPVSVRNLLLATLLVASNAVFAAHVTAHHVTSKVSTCEWCVCQGQTPAGPLPVASQLYTGHQVSPPLPPPIVTIPAEPQPHGYQPRAPPVDI